MGQGQVEQPVLRELVRPHVRARVRRSNHQRRQNRRNARHVRLHRENGPRCPPDCQEAVGKSEYNVIVVENGLRVNHVSGTFYLEFESCQGYEYQANVGPDDYETELNLGELKATSNDLAGFVSSSISRGRSPTTRSGSSMLPSSDTAGRISISKTTTSSARKPARTPSGRSTPATTW